MKKLICLLAAAVLGSSVLVYGAEKADTAGETGLILFEDKAESGSANITYASGVTPEMCGTDYWKNKLGDDSDRLLMSVPQIDALNKKMLAEPNTCMNDIENMPSSYEATASERTIPTRALYVNGEKINNDEYFGKMINAMLTTGYSGMTDTQYAVVTKRANMKDWPTEDIVGYSPDDTDDELQNSSMNVNEPFVIRQKCVIDGKTFYNGSTFNCSGWVPADCLAICATKQEWLDAWKVNTAAGDFIVVTQDKIVLEPSMYVPDISEVKLMLGTVLKLVPKSEMPQTVAERGTWNNYVVYLPTRDENGNYKRQYALISQHCNVSVGFLPLTQANVLDTAFSCLGNRYGWGGMLDSMDCSAYTRHIYRCFGLELPRNTTWQTQIPDHVSYLSGMSSEEKTAFIEKLPVGSLLMFKGHITVYIGSENGKAYVISDTGSLSDSEGELKVIGQMSVIITPLTVRRGNGSTWLENMIYAVSFDDSTTDTFVYGDADADQMVSAADAAVILQKTLTESYCMPIEEKTENWLKYADVDGDGALTASDAASVMQKTLVDTYKMPVETK